MQVSGSYSALNLIPSKVPFGLAPGLSNFEWPCVVCVCLFIYFTSNPIDQTFLLLLVEEKYGPVALCYLRWFGGLYY
jgi:hypothetical protein